MSDYPRPEGAPEHKKQKVEAELSEDFKLLKAMEGKWESKLLMYFAPGQPPIEARSVTEGKLVHGKFLEGKHTTYGPDGKEQMTGTEILGYDPKANEWHLYWIDSFSNVPIVSRGKREGMIVTLRGVMSDMTGKEVKIRNVYDFKESTFEMFKGKDEADTELADPLIKTFNKDISGPASLSHVTLLCHDIDATRDWYKEKLGFEVTSDVKFGPENKDRWTTIRAPEQGDLCLTLATANPESASLVGKQGGGAPFLCLTTRDIHRDLPLLEAKGVQVTRKLEEKFYGIDCGIVDNNGTEINFIQVKPH